jgi:hypothetical protein
MSENKFKTLMHGGKYVKKHALIAEITYSDVPEFMDSENTIESLIESTKEMGDCYIANQHIKHISQCELIEFEMIRVL